jgi:hypothetical protein
MKFYDVETPDPIPFIETENGHWARRSDVLKAIEPLKAERDRLLSDLEAAHREIDRMRYR